MLRRNGRSIGFTWHAHATCRKKPPGERARCWENRYSSRLFSLALSHIARSIRLSLVNHDVLSEVGHRGTVRMIATHRNAELRGLGLALGRLVRDDLHFDYTSAFVSSNTCLSWGMSSHSLYSFLAPGVISVCLFAIRTCFRLLTHIDARTSSTRAFTIH